MGNNRMPFDDRKGNPVRLHEIIVQVSSFFSSGEIIIITDRLSSTILVISNFGCKLLVCLLPSPMVLSSSRRVSPPVPRLSVIEIKRIQIVRNRKRRLSEMSFVDYDFSFHAPKELDASFFVLPLELASPLLPSL